MQLQGIKIEYFITGGISIIWFALILQLWSPFPIDESGKEIDFILKLEDLKILLIPLAYILGMMVDYLARLMLNPISNNIEKNVYASFDSKIISKLKNSNILIYILHSKPDLYKEIEVRLTRYRIARGFIINVILIAILLVFTILTEDEKLSIANKKLNIGIILGVLTIIGIISFFMWRRFLISYYKQQIYILQFLEKNHNSSS